MTSNTDSNVLALESPVRYTSNTRSIELVFDQTPDLLRSTAMSVALAEPVLVRPTAAGAGRPATVPVRKRSTRPGPGTGPVAAPRRLRFVAQPATARACRPAAPGVGAVSSPRTGPSTWRLTERGLTVVLVLAAALVAASVAVVGLTALRVTGESYHPGHVAPASAPVLVEP